MKITGLTCYPLRAPIEGDHGTGREAWSEVTILVVKLETDAGIVGWGEGYCRYVPGVYAKLVDELLKPLVIGTDPFAVEATWQKLFRAFTGRSGGMLPEALSAIDIAIWDIVGKAVNQPLYNVFGHAGRGSLIAYAAAIGWSDDKAAERQARLALDLGFKQIKVRLGKPVKAAIDRVRLIRNLVGPDIRLVADANWVFDVGDALVVARELEALNYYWFEEPTIPENDAGYRELAQKCSIRIAGGESEHTSFGIAPLIASRTLTIVQPDVARSSGITETRKIIALSRAFHTTYSPHIGFGGAICAAASLHLAASAANFESYECMLYTSPLRDLLATEPVASCKTLKDGALPLPTGPGLGIEIDERALAKYLSP